MKNITVILTVKQESDVAAVREMLVEHLRLSRDEPGCLRFETYQSQSDPKVFVLSERWESEAALDEHRKAKGYTEIYQPKVLPLVERTAHVGTPVE